MYINKVLQGWAHEHGYQFSGNVALIPGELPMSVALYPSNNNCYCVSAAVDIASIEGKADMKKISKQAKHLGALVVNNKTGLVQITISTMGRKRLFAKIDKAVAELPELMREFGVNPQEICEHCKEPGCNAFALVNAALRPVHSVCNNRDIESQMQQVEDNRNNGNYIFATIAALLGAIVGALPSLVTMIFADYIIAVFFAAIPLVAAFAYRKAGGVQNWFMPFVVIVMSLISACALTFATLYFEFGAGTPLATFYKLVFHPRNRMDVLSLLGQVLLFSGLGIVIAWNFMAKTGKQQIKELETMREQVVMMSPAQQPAEQQELHNQPEEAAPQPEEV